MYRLDIITGDGTYTLHEDEVGSITEDNVLTVAETVSDLEAGNFFKGWPPDYPREKDPLVFALGKDAKITGYVLYPFEAAPQVEEPTETGPVEGSVEPFTARVEYLGNKLTVTGCQLYKDGINHVLPVKVNGEDHVAYIKQEALRQLLAAWLEDMGIPVTDYLVIVPDVAMDYITSKEYLIDYVGGIAKERAGTNAKAWTGWRTGSEAED